MCARMAQHVDAELTSDADSTVVDGESHATTPGAATAGAVTGAVIGLTGGPIGAIVGAVGGAIVGAAAERMMHGEDDAALERMDVDNGHDRGPALEADAKED
jgi:outer membrane lipoprotein SlyB